MAERTMPFGRYKGRPLDALPNDYLDWLRTLDDLREPLRRALDAEHARRQTRTRWEPQIAGPDRAVCDAIIGAGLRALAKRHHPDAGGSHADMIAVTAAADWLRQQIRGLAA